MKREVRLSSKIKKGLYGHALIVRFLIVYYNNTTFGLEKKNKYKCGTKPGRHGDAQERVVNPAPNSIVKNFTTNHERNPISNSVTKIMKTLNRP